MKGAPMKNPNIILVLIDDLGYGDVSCFNPQSKIPTPNLERLAQQGRRFTDCHASSAVCSPSRYALMTGRYNWRSRLKSSVLPGQSSPLLEPGRETLATLLKGRGYRTACVGKWHLGLGWQTKGDYALPATYQDPNVDQDLCFTGIDFTAPITDGPNQHGFDYFYGMPASLDQPPFVHIENDRVLTPPDHMTGVKGLVRHGPEQPFDVEYGPAEPGFAPAAMVPEMDEKVLSLVDEYADGEQPFFIYYPTLAVHGPLMPAPQFRGKSGLNAYADFVLQVDDFVGRLTAKLEEKGIAFQLRHCCNSAGILNFPEMHLDMVRAGIALYGCDPSPATMAALRWPTFPNSSREGTTPAIFTAAGRRTSGREATASPSSSAGRGTFPPGQRAARWPA